LDSEYKWEKKSLTMLNRIDIGTELVGVLERGILRIATREGLSKTTHTMERED
jgi:hypothetical protein